MKTKQMYTLLLISLVLAGCAPGGPPLQEDNLAGAQQTLDALNSGVAENAPGPTAVVPTSVPPTRAPTITPLPTRAPTITPLPTRAASEIIIVYEFDNQPPAWDVNCFLTRQPMENFGTGWNEDDQLFGNNLNCEMAFDLPITVSGVYDVYLVATYAPDFGHLSINLARGIETDFVFNISIYDPEVKPTDKIPIGQWHFTTGETNQIVFMVYDKHEASTDYKFGLDYLELVLIQPDS